MAYLDRIKIFMESAAALNEFLYLLLNPVYNAAW